MLASYVWLNLLDHTTIHVHLVKTLWIACNWICNTCYENISHILQTSYDNNNDFCILRCCMDTQSVSQLIFFTANDFPVPLKLILSVTVQFEFEKQLNLLLFVPVWWGTSPKLLWNLICKFLFYFSKDITHEHPIYDKITSGHLLWATSHHRGNKHLFSLSKKYHSVALIGISLALSIHGLGCEVLVASWSFHSFVFFTLFHSSYPPLPPSKVKSKKDCPTWSSKFTKWIGYRLIAFTRLPGCSIDIIWFKKKRKYM